MRSHNAGARPSGPFEGGRAESVDGSAIGREFRRSWPLVILTMIGLCFGQAGFSTYAFGVFIEPLAKSFDWPISKISSWALCFSIGTIVGAPAVGFLVDRLGVRRVIAFSIPLFSIALAGYAAIWSDIASLYCMGFAVGLLGTGTGAIAYSRAVTDLFVAGRGTALGLMASGIGVSAIFAPPLMQHIADAYSWRAGFLFIAACALIPLPFTYWLPRSHARTPRPDSGSNIKSHLSIHSIRQGTKLPALWLLTIGSIAYSMSIGGALFNLIPFLTSNGMSRVEAASYAGLFGIFTIVGKVATGAMIDRLNSAIVCASLLIAQSIGFVLLGGGAPALVPVMIAVISFAHGGQIAGGFYCVARYLGLENYGSFCGIITMASGIGFGLGPFIFSRLKELSGSYTLSLTASCGLSLIDAATFISIFCLTVSAAANRKCSA